MNDNPELEEKDTKAADPAPPPAPAVAPPAPAEPDPIQPAAPAAPEPKRTSQPAAPRSMVRMLVVAGVVLAIGICIVVWLLSRSEKKLQEFVIKKVAEV